MIWGTLVVPTTGLLAYPYFYPGAPTDAASLVAAFLGTYRPTSLFRSSNIEAGFDPLTYNDRQIDVLYGSLYLPKFDPVENQWTLMPNRMNATPLMGPPGFGNFFNAYTWWMHKFHGQLYLGTFDFLYVGARIAEPLLPEIPKDITKLAMDYEGADVWVFPDGYNPAFPITLSGAGNIANLGIRTMITLQDTLYFGAANPMNLLTDGPALGGWELIQVTKTKR